MCIRYELQNDICNTFYESFAFIFVAMSKAEYLLPLVMDQLLSSIDLQVRVLLCALLLVCTSYVKKKKKVNWMGRLFSAFIGAHLLFTSIGLNYSIYNVAVRGLPVLCTMSLLPFWPKLVPLYTPESRGASYSKVPCSRAQHAGPHRVQTSYVLIIYF